jgi:phosphoserine phosphatase RsbU/P
MGACDRPPVELLFEQAPCGHMLADATGTLVEVNATMSKWLGYAPEELLAGVKFPDLLTMGGRLFHQTHLVPLLRMQGSVAEVKLAFRRKEGTELPIIVNAREFEWQGSTFVHIAAFVVLERHKYERELLLERKRAESLAADNARGQEELTAERARAEERAVFAEKLVGMVSHDIRNPLSVVHMSAALLERTALTELQRQVVDRVSRAVARVQNLVDDLLDFTQAKLGRGLHVTPFEADLHKSVGDSIADLRVGFAGREIRHVRHGSAKWMADPNRIVQAVGNLVANAIAHGAPDGPVTVTTQDTAHAFTIAVHNFGPPIPAAHIPKLFQPMVRGADVRAEGGVGLGLFIVKEIVERHGGGVHVDSFYERGTTFTISIPPRPGPASGAG